MASPRFLGRWEAFEFGAGQAHKKGSLQAWQDAREERRQLRKPRCAAADGSGSVLALKEEGWLDGRRWKLDLHSGLDEKWRWMGRESLRE